MLSPGRNRHRFKKQIACTQPFFHDFVWNLGIHIDQTISFLTPIRSHFVFRSGLSLSCTKSLLRAQEVPRTCLYSSRGSSLVSCNPGIRNKTVRPFQKCRPLYSLIFHNHLSPVLPGISPSLTFSSLPCVFLCQIIKQIVSVIFCFSKMFSSNFQSASSTSSFNPKADIRAAPCPRMITCSSASDVATVT